MFGLMKKIVIVMIQIKLIERNQIQRKKKRRNKRDNLYQKNNRNKMTIRILKVNKRKSNKMRLLNMKRKHLIPLRKKLKQNSFNKNNNKSTKRL